MQCELGSATIHYEERGEGRPIVFLHGWTLDHSLELVDYEPIFEARTGWRRLYADLPGMGRSTAKAITNQDDMLGAVLVFIDRVVGGERFLLAGTSLGGYLARAVAVRRRAQVAGLLLRQPAVIADTTRRTLPAFAPVVRDDALVAAVPEPERTALGNVLVQTPDYLAAARKKSRTLYQPALAATAPLAGEIRADPGRYGFSFDLAAEERGFAAPTLVITGRQDTTVGYRDAWAILESYPRATFAVLDCADHTWPVEAPNLLAPLVDDWLSRIALAERS